VKKSLIPSLILAATALLVAGCGGSSRSSAHPATKADYAKALNDICSSATTKVKALGSVSSISDLATIGPKISDITQKEAGDIAAVQPPADIKSTADDYVSILKQGNAKLKDAIDAAKAGDTSKAQQLISDLSALDTKATTDARTLGATSCASG